MAGIFDEVMEGIAAKEKQGGQTAPETPPAAPAAPPAAQQGQAPQQAVAETEEKPVNNYHDDFKKKYGGRKTA